MERFRKPDDASFEQSKSSGKFTANLLAVVARDGLTVCVRSRRFPLYVA
jgi:hypothetical protein